MNFYYNPLDKKCKSEIGAVKSGQAIKISGIRRFPIARYGDYIGQNQSKARLRYAKNRKRVYC